MTATVGFLVFLAVTLILLALVVMTGKASKRAKHLTLVVATVISLGITIYYAERLGKEYDFSGAETIYGVHLFFAKAAVLAYLLPVFTGIKVIRGSLSRHTHGRVAYAVIGLTVITAVTGVWMILAAEPI